MRLKKSGLLGAVLFVCVGVADAGFFESLASTLAENKEVEQAPDCTLSADEAYARSIELLSDGRQAEAEDLIQSAVKSHRDDIRILFAKAVLERSRWRKSSADVWFAMVCNMQGNKALSRAAWLSMKLDREHSTGNLNELVELSDKHSDEIFLLWIGAIQHREQARKNGVPRGMGSVIGALGKKRYEKLLEFFRIGPVMVHHTYANLLTEVSGDFELALEHRLLAISMEMKDWTLQGLGNTLIAMKRYEWANAVWAQTVRLYPSDAEYWNRWGATLLALYRIDEAEDKYQVAVRLSPQNKIYQTDLEYIQKYGSTIEKDLERFETLQVAMRYGDTQGLKELAECYSFGRGVMQDQEKAFELYKHAVRKGDNSALKALGECYYRGDGVEKDQELAFKFHQRYLESFPSSEKGNFKMGICYLYGKGVEKDDQMAAQYFEAVLEVNSGNYDAWYRLMNILIESENPVAVDYPRAVKMAEQMLASDLDEYNLEILADAYFKNKQYADAAQTMERLVEYLKTRMKKRSLSFEILRKLERYKKLRQQTGGSS